MKKYSLYIIIILFAAACGSPNQPAGSKITMSDYDWLNGLWLAHGLEYFEEWRDGDDSTKYGRAYKIEGQDTIITEQIVFSLRNGNFVYTPTVKSQNNGLPIEFKAVSVKSHEIQFENLGHDFPNRIIYFNTSDAQIDVRLEQVQEGNVTQSYDILMSRIE